MGCVSARQGFPLSLHLTEWETSDLFETIASRNTL
jgi:hypothetical protein